MIQLQNNLGMRRRLAARILLFVWIWCLTSATLAMAMMTSAMDIEHAIIASDTVSDASGSHSNHPEAHQDSSKSSPPACCPEESDFSLSTYLQANLLVTAALLSYFFLPLFIYRPAYRYYATHWLPSKLPRRLHALHCTYLN
tara:strand:+ start:938 stop:1363 length:426 start_codon:yes stop_codon:yes gene_type:complete